MDATQFMTLLRARVDWLSAKVTNASNAWNEYQRYSDNYARQYGPHPWTPRESWAQRLTTWAGVGGIGLSVQWRESVDRPYGVRFTDVFGDMRDAARAYQAIVMAQGSTVIFSPLQMIEAANLRERGDQLARRAQALSVQWANSYASVFDHKVTSDTDAFLRSVATLTPFSRYQASVPDLTTALTTPGAGSTTGAALPPPPGEQGLPPWVAPVAGGILIVGIGYAVWRYSKVH
jgi:hypothetical protein